MRADTKRGRSACEMAREPTSLADPSQDFGLPWPISCKHAAG
jgi:hypothetical protein